MKKQIIILSLIILSTVSGIAQQSTLTRTMVNRKYGFGYPSLTKKDKMGYPLIEALTIPAIYDETTNVTFSDEYENLIGVKLNGKWGYIDPTGATKIPFKYDEAGYFHEGIAPVIIGGKCGFINKSGTLVIPLKYDYATSFTDGVAYVELGGKIGFINKTGVAIVPIKYDKQTDPVYQKCYHCGGAMNSFKDGKAVVALGGKCGIVDAKGTFTECKDEALETITLTGVAKKANPSIWIKGSCQTNQDIRTVTINGTTHNEVKANYDNQTMFCFMNGLKAGDKFTIQIIHAKGCTYVFKQPDGLEFDPGQDNLMYKAPVPVNTDALGVETTTFKGTVNAHSLVTFLANDVHDIKKIILNDDDISSKLYPSKKLIVNLGLNGFKRGDHITIKVVHVKGTTITLGDPSGIDIEK
jgi:hypothetical protein